MCVTRQFQLVTYKLNVIHHNFGRDFLRRSPEHINFAINNVNEGRSFFGSSLNRKFLSMHAGTAYEANRVPDATANAQSYRQIKGSRRAQQNFIHRAKRLLMQNVCCRSGTVFFFASRFTLPRETLKFISHSVLFKCRSDKRRLYSCCSVICTILTCPRT